MTAAQVAVATAEAQSDDGFLGHPKGLAFLAFTEVWERFSYYGMTALLSLYMVQQLLLPGHAEQVLGLGAVRSLFEIRGPMSNVAFASLIYGWYGGLVYFTPIFGGMVADRWLGTRTTVVIGALLMSAGHLAMAFEQSFLAALALLIVGSGFLKGNISAQVGQLYPRDDESRRTQGFTIFSAGINVGSVLGPLGCGAIAAIYGWHAGFALAGGLMIIALVTYLAGRRYLPDGRVRRPDKAHLPPLSANEKRRSWLLIVVIAFAVLPHAAYSMIWSIGLLWIDAQVSLASPFGTVPTAWFNSVDSFASIVAVPPLVALWAWQAQRGREPGSIAKMGIGSAIIGASALLFVIGCLLAGPGQKVSVVWPLLAYTGMGIGFLYYWPVLLALISQAAPAKINSTMMGVAFLALFVASLVMGWVGSFYDQMSAAAFWAVDAALAFAGAVIVMILNRPLSRALEPRSHPDA